MSRMRGSVYYLEEKHLLSILNRFPRGGLPPAQTTRPGNDDIYYKIAYG